MPSAALYAALGSARDYSARVEAGITGSVHVERILEVGRQGCTKTVCGSYIELSRRQSIR
jgi:hypothetical protein